MRCATLLSRGRLTRATLIRPSARDTNPRERACLHVAARRVAYNSARSRTTSARSRPGDLDHLEVRLRRTTVRAAPVVGDVVPPGSGCDAVLGPPLGFVVLEAALHTDEQFERVGMLVAQALLAAHFIAPIS